MGNGYKRTGQTGYAGEGIQLQEKAGKKEHDKDFAHRREGIAQGLEEQIEHCIVLDLLCLQSHIGFFITFG